MGLCVSHGAMDVPQSPASPMDTRLSQRALHVLWNHTCPLGLWMSHRAICVPSVHVPWSHLCATESYVSLGTGIHRCPMEPSTFCGPISVPCRCPGRHPYPTNLRMLHRAIPPSVGQLWQQPPPRPHFGVPPPKSAQSLHPCSPFQAGSQASRAPGCLWHIQTRGNRDVSLCG